MHFQCIVVQLAFNTRLEKLNLNVRNALSQIIPIEEIIEVAAQGFGRPTVGPINPQDSGYYNFDISLLQSNPEHSEKLLKQEGYRKVDGMWRDVRNKKLTLTLNYQTGSSIYESIALIINDQLTNFGIEVKLQGHERSLLLKKSRSHDFELSLSSFRGGPLAHNFAPLFSTEAANPGGLNFSGFGTARSDSVINLINFAAKKEEKISGLKELQRMLHEEKTMLFLFFEKDRIIVSKRFTNVYGFSRSPSYNVTKFQLANPN